MFRRMTSSNEIIGLTMMLLLGMALVASHAGATTEAQEIGAMTIENTGTAALQEMPFTATIEGHFNGRVLTVSIDTMAHFGQFQIERD